jgi:hypothetical protein
LGIKACIFDELDDNEGFFDLEREGERAREKGGLKRRGSLIHFPFYEKSKNFSRKQRRNECVPSFRT